MIQILKLYKYTNTNKLLGIAYKTFTLKESEQR